MKVLALTIAAALALPIAADAAATPPKPVAKVTVAQARATTVKAFVEAKLSGSVISYKVGKCTVSKTGHAFCAFTVKGRTGTKVQNCSGRVEVRRYQGDLQWRIAPGAVCK